MEYTTLFTYVQDSGKLDRRTTTAVESLLRLGASPSPAPQYDDPQWTPPSPAPSFASGAESQLSLPQVAREEVVTATSKINYSQHKSCDQCGNCKSYLLSCNAVCPLMTKCMHFKCVCKCGLLRV